MKKRLRKILNSVIVFVFLFNTNIYGSGITADDLLIFGAKRNVSSLNAAKKRHLAPHSQIANGTINELFKAKELLSAHKGTNAYLENQIKKEIKVLGRDSWKKNRIKSVDVTLEENIGKIKYNVKGLKFIKLVKVTTLMNQTRKANLVSVNPEGLLACTGQFAHVGLSGKHSKHYNNMPGMYMDSEFYAPIGMFNDWLRKFSSRTLFI